MIEIIFQKDRDARRMYGHIVDCLPAGQPGSGHVQLDADRRRVKIDGNAMPNEAFHIVRQCVYEFIVLKKRDDWFRGILEEQFFYDDSHEQEQILEIIYSLVDGNREDLESFLSGPDEKQIVQEAIAEIFTGSISFSFDSFMMFRLKPFFDKLSSYAAVAIDEYKLEQEYQMFVQTLRDFLAGRPALKPLIHLIVGEGTFFYDEHVRQITRSELVRTIDRKLLGNHPVYVDSVTIAPLLSLAPSVIRLYTDQPEQPLVRTICNIFEERVKIYPVQTFEQKNNQQNVQSSLDFQNITNYNNLHTK